MSYCTNGQKAMLIELMESEGDLRSGKFSNSFTRHDAKAKWMEIATKLNAIPGATKDWMHWRKAWQDFRCKAKAKQAALVRESRGTGGGPSTCSQLTSAEEAVIGMMAPAVVTGHSQSAESLVPSFTFDEVTIDYCPGDDVVFVEPSDDSPGISTSRSEDATPQRRRKKSSVQEELVSLAQQKMEIKENYYKKKLEILERQAMAMELQSVVLKEIANNLQRK